MDLEGVQVHRFLKERGGDMRQMLKYDLIKSKKPHFDLLFTQILSKRSNLTNAEADQRFQHVSVLNGCLSIKLKSGCFSKCVST